MGQIVALMPETFLSHKNWDPENVPTGRQGVWRWMVNSSCGALGGVAVGVIFHFRKHPLDITKMRQVKWTSGMDRRNRLYPPILGHFRTFTLRNTPQLQELKESCLLWGCRVGALFMVSYGIETVGCITSKRPYGSSKALGFVSGAAGGYVFSMSDLVPKKARWMTTFSMGIMFILAGWYDGVPDELSDEEISARRSSKIRTLTIKNEGTRELSPTEKRYQEKLKRKIEALYKASDDPAKMIEGKVPGENAAGNEYIFNKAAAFKNRAKEWGPKLWADKSTQRIVEERQQLEAAKAATATK